MRIGIPREIKPLEGRVALLPSACAELVRHGHQVLVERGAGRLSGYGDEDFARAGAALVESAEGLYAEAELIVKVKEPLGPELDRLRADHLLFCFLHLAANRELGARLRAIGLTAVAFETVQVDGRLPLLAPMSEVAGRIATQVGMHLLHQPQGGAGVLLGGLAGTPRGRVVVIGAGTAGGAAAALAARIGADVTVFDRNPEVLHRMRALGDNVTALYASHQDMETAVSGADLLVGAVLVAGRRAPRVVSREMVARMRDGSVIVDISVDQGGCVETTRPTTYEDPVYREQGVLHFTVTNMPGAVPRSATQVLSANLIPYVLRIAEPDWERDKALAAGINVRAGDYVHPAIAAELK
jgi:alanine dehydrogenase